jgi:hypothetical protein
MLIICMEMFRIGIIMFVVVMPQIFMAQFIMRVIVTKIIIGTGFVAFAGRRWDDFVAQFLEVVDQIIVIDFVRLIVSSFMRTIAAGAASRRPAACVCVLATARIRIASIAPAATTTALASACRFGRFYRFRAIVNDARFRRNGLIGKTFGRRFRAGRRALGIRAVPRPATSATTPPAARPRFIALFLPSANAALDAVAFHQIIEFLIR